MKFLVSYLYNNRYSLLTLLLCLFVLLFKIYTLFINPITAGSIGFSSQTFIFYNTLSFNKVAQSFLDWNHPGTPIYYLNYIFSFFWLNDDINQFQNFIYLSHFLNSLLIFYSFWFFINYFKFYLKVREILIFLFFLFSFHFSLQTLEIIDPSNYLIPLSLISVVFLFKTFFSNNYKYLYINSFVLSLCLSIKLTFVPFFISAYISIFFKFIKDDKFKFKKYFLFNFFIFIFLIFWNFPILGRMPKIFYNIFFSRDDTLFNFLDIINILKYEYIFLSDKNFLLLFSFFIFFVAFTFLIVQKFILEKKNKNQIYFIFYILLFLSFLHILFVSNVEMKDFLTTRPSTLFRHLCFYSIFVIPLFFVIGSNFFYKKYLNFILYFFLILFITTTFNYLIERNNQIVDLDFKKNILNNKLNKLNVNRSKLAYYGDSGYIFEDEFIHFYANSIYAGEKYNSQLLKKFNDFKFFRSPDFIFYAYNLKDRTKFSAIQSKYEDWDIFLKKKLNYRTYLILSHNSHKMTSTFPGFRSNDFFIKSFNSKVKYILLYGPEITLKLNNYNAENYIYKLSNYLEIENTEKIYVENDIWYLVTLKNEM